MSKLDNSASYSNQLRIARVLVVDDILETRENIAAALKLFCNDTIACAPEDAIRTIRNTYPPIDALVTDLRFPPADQHQEWITSRLSTPKHGIELLQRLGSNCPASVVITGSISSRDIAKMQSEAVCENGTPAARFTLKSAGIGALTKQLEGALADSKMVSSHNRAQVISQISPPTLNTETRYDRSNSAAISFEVLQNYLKKLDDCITMLKERCDLDNWHSWKQSNLLIRSEAAYLKTFNSTRCLGQKSLETLNTLHQLAGHFMLLDPEILIIPDNLAAEAQARAALQELSIAYKKTSAEINKCLEGLKIQAQGLFSLDEKLCEIFDARFLMRLNSNNPIFYHKHGLSGKIKISDPDQEIRNFLRELNTALQPHQATLDIRFSCDNYQLQDFEIMRDTLNWGSSYRIGVRILEAREQGNPTWAYLQSLRYSIDKLSNAKLLYVDKHQFSATAASGMHFEFFIKASERDLKAEKRELDRIAQIQVTALDSFKVKTENNRAYKIEVPSGSFIALNFNPQRLVKESRNLCAVCFDNTFIIASSERHIFADRLIYFYLRQNYLLDKDCAFEIARDSIRISNQFDDCVVEESEQHWHPQLEKIFEDLGFSTRRPHSYELPRRNLLDGFYLGEY